MFPSVVYSLMSSDFQRWLADYAAARHASVPGVRLEMQELYQLIAEHFLAGRGALPPAATVFELINKLRESARMTGGTHPLDPRLGPDHDSSCEAPD